MPTKPSGIPEALWGFGTAAFVWGCMYLMGIEPTFWTFFVSFWLGVGVAIGNVLAYPKKNNSKPH